MPREVGELLCSPSTCRDVLQSRHLWMWERTIFMDLCSSEEDEEEEEEKVAGALTKRVLCSRLRQYMK